MPCLASLSDEWVLLSANSVEPARSTWYDPPRSAPTPTSPPYLLPLLRPVNLSHTKYISTAANMCDQDRSEFPQRNLNSRSISKSMRNLEYRPKNPNLVLPVMVRMGSTHFQFRREDQNTGHFSFLSLYSKEFLS